MTTSPEEQFPQQVPPPADAVPPQQPYAQPQQPYGQPPVGAYPPSPAWAGQVPAGPPLRPDEERLWSTLAHAGGIVASFVAPLVIWLVFKERSRFVNDQAKEALNFQITLIIGYVVSMILTIIVIGAFLMLIVWVLAIVFGIMGALAANKGQPYRYPVAIRFIK